MHRGLIKTMNSKPDTNIKPTTAEIAKRIADERNRLNAELSLQSRLSAQRLTALDAASVEALELIEQNLTQCLDRQSRIEERIAILEERLEESQAHDEHDRLDALAASARRAHDRAATLLKKYPAAARAVAALLAEVRTCEQQIVAANHELEAAKRDTVTPADPPRFPARGNFGLVIDTVALHETVNLPNEIDGRPAYWTPKDSSAWIADAIAGGMPTMRMR